MKHFDRYIYGKSPTAVSFKMKKLSDSQDDPYHPVLSEDQLLELTWL